ncbi:MAG: hypothetical protein ABI806_09425 [Candidatus Solibacter sp.]
MQNSRDSSVWRTLAVAFGDGLAFGVGVTLTRSAARIAANRTAIPALAIAPAPEPPKSEWYKEGQQRTAPQDPLLVPPPPRPSPAANLPMEAALANISRRVTETGGQIDRRLVEMETRIQRELDALDDQDHQLAEGVETRLDALRGEIAAAVTSQRQTLETEIRTLRSQMASVHKEFAETLARFMDEQIAKAVATRMQTFEAEIRAAVREEAKAADHGRQLAELRELMETQDRNMRGMVQALGESFLKAATPPVPEEQPSGSIPEAAGDLPDFAPPRSRKPLWRLPVVSSFVAATGSLLLMHYL